MPSSLKVGILDDMADLSALGDEAPEEGQGGAAAAGVPTDLTGWIDREIAALRAGGRPGVEVEFVHAYALGLPSGTAEAVEQAYRQLAEAGVGLIVGPAIGDNALVAAPLAEQLRIPTIQCSGVTRARSRWMFQQQSGSDEDESLLVARHMARLGCRRLGVVREISPAGTRHLKVLEAETRMLGIEIVAAQALSPLADDATDAVAALLVAEPDGVVYLGAGATVPALAGALERAGWNGPRMMNAAGPRDHHAAFADACDGWFHLHMCSDGNETLKAAMASLAASPQLAPAVARGHDLGRLVAEGLSRAAGAGRTSPSRDDLRVSLEQVKWLPAAQGREGTLLGFGPCDHAALHGRYLVVRQWLGGESREVV